MTPPGAVRCTVYPAARVGPGTISRKKERSGDGEAGAAKRGVLAHILPLPFKGCRG